jgi:hypothetical protein
VLMLLFQFREMRAKAHGIPPLTQNIYIVDHIYPVLSRRRRITWQTND